MTAQTPSIDNAPLDNIFHSAPELILHSPPKKGPTCCGRKVSRCDCLSKKIFFVIATVVGSILLILGLLALIGYCAPASGGGIILQKLNAAATFVAAKLGSDLFTLSLFTVAIGFGFTLSGSVGLGLEHCQNRAKVKEQE